MRSWGPHTCEFEREEERGELDIKWKDLTTLVSHLKLNDQL